ncbi:hypothetical protein FC65_GL000673 [Ligilactobacillus acidipiscis DSM 15836]|uniref:Uncharacterized protein n=1 Tax=Ligilactobacillus acidipiscis DSM 15836 TaxID=1423716 RepID=A0ABR5PLJ8_9LACO|nr:hypothetical protein [Ligilactobacillus acidipiscis]KRM30333.1 hypothetical protein FC65_GL000673 [Ligilactobacillus acidipiscis DSM 15836]GAW63423.1 hypothetical protein Lacidipiscis_00606 [Ligilactobacillus acidipiscis]GEN19631.1 hypothetical protein LAC02_29120 [Ligilactobacillus acidipiscis]
MNKKELEEYINNNSRTIEIFSEKALEYQTGKNNDRPKKKRWGEVKISRAVDGMINTFMENVHDKIKTQVKRNEFEPQRSWIDFITKNNVLDELEESVIEMEFE